MFDFVQGCCIFELVINFKEVFFVNEWVQFVEVVVEFDNVVFFLCILVILELVVVIFKFFEGFDILFEVVKLNGFFGLGKFFY